MHATPTGIKPVTPADRISAVPLVGILIVNWRGLCDTRECGESLRQIRYPRARVYVTDNGSGDGSAEALRAEFPTFRVIENDTNLGFSGATNQLMTQAIAEGCDYVLLLNNDTIVDRDFLEPMVEAAQADERIGLVGCKIYAANPPDVIWFAGGRIDRELFFLFAHIGEGHRDNDSFAEARETQWATGCCLLARASMIAEIGMLDERFGYYYEDVDWCVRARAAGWKIWYEPRGKIWHKIGRSTGRRNLVFEYFNHRNVLFVGRRLYRPPERYLQFVRGIRQAVKYSPYRCDKPAVYEGVLDGLLLQNRALEKIGQANWSNALVAAERRARTVCRKLLRRRKCRTEDDLDATLQTDE